MNTPILIVEDELPDQNIIIAALTKAKTKNGHPLDSSDYDVADSLASAERLLTTRTYATILLDLDLPDSMQLNTYKKAKELAPHTCIIVISGTDDERTVFAALDTGAEDYVSKNILTSAGLVTTITHAQFRHDHMAATFNELRAAFDVMSTTLKETANNIHAVNCMLQEIKQIRI